MFFNKKEDKIVTASQDFKSVVEALTVQFNLFTATSNAAYKFGIMLAEIILEANEREGSKLVAKIMEGMQKQLADSVKK